MADEKLTNLPDAENIVAQAAEGHDSSYQLIAQIFGNDWQKLYLQKTGIASENADLIFQLLGMLNSIALGGVAVLIVYVVAAGVIGTAHEGEAFGKRYSTLYTPLRTALSVASLTPLPWLGGLSLMQGLILLMVSVSLSFANQLWEKTVDYLADNGGQMVATVPHNVTENATAVAKGMLKSQVIQLYFADQDNITMSGPVYNVTWQSASSGTTGSYKLEFTAPPNHPSLEHKMGSVTIPCSSQDAQLCVTRLAGMKTLAATTFSAAQQLVYEDLADPKGTLVANAVKGYAENMRGTIKALVQSSKPEFNTALENYRVMAKEAGWISAGSWYWTIAGLQESAADAIGNLPEYSSPSTLLISSTAYEDFTRHEAAVEAYTDEMEEKLLSAAAVHTESMDTPESVYNSVKRTISAPFDGSLHFVVNGLTHGDPIANMKSIGEYMVTAAETAYAGYVVLAGTAGFAEKMADGDITSGKWAGFFANALTGGSTSGFAGAAKAVVNAIALPVVFLLVPIFTAGLFLAFYLPALPFVLWISGVIGWLIVILESMVASPLWAAAHAVPEGEGMAGQHAKQGYFLLMGALFRPPLMVLGFLLTFWVTKGVAWTLGQGLNLFLSSLQADRLTGPLSFAVLLVLAAVTIIVLVHRTLRLITWLPDNVLRWIGQSAASLGDQEDEAKIRGVVMGAINTGSTSAGRMTESIRGNGPAAGGNGDKGNGPAGSDATSNVSDDDLSAGSNAEKKSKFDKEL